MPTYRQTVAGLYSELRLDRYIAEKLGLLSRSQIKARQLTSKINGNEVKISRLVKNGDEIELIWNAAEPVNIIPENIPLNIIFENDRVIAINKPQGMVVHPGAGNRQGTFANALYYRKINRGFPQTEDFKTEYLQTYDLRTFGSRPGIVHRLDKDTSGVMIAAYDDETLAFLAGQFKSGKVRKTYIAIINGIPKEKKGRIETCIARDPRNRKCFTVTARGRPALTCYSVIKTWRTHSLILLQPKTGRTHQLRVHLRYIGHPVTGDPLYGFTDTLFPNASLMLHSRILGITLPGETQPSTFKAPLPQRFKEMIHFLNISHGDMEAQRHKEGEYGGTK